MRCHGITTRLCRKVSASPPGALLSLRQPPFDAQRVGPVVAPPAFAPDASHAGSAAVPYLYTGSGPPRHWPSAYAPQPGSEHHYQRHGPGAHAEGAVAFLDGHAIREDAKCTEQLAGTTVVEAICAEYAGRSALLFNLPGACLRVCARVLKLTLRSVCVCGCACTVGPVRARGGRIYAALPRVQHHVAGGPRGSARPRGVRRRPVQGVRHQGVPGAARVDGPDQAHLALRRVPEHPRAPAHAAQARADAHRAAPAPAPAPACAEAEAEAEAAGASGAEAECGPGERPGWWWGRGRGWVSVWVWGSVWGREQRGGRVGVRGVGSLAALCAVRACVLGAQVAEPYLKLGLGAWIPGWFGLAVVVRVCGYVLSVSPAQPCAFLFPHPRSALEFGCSLYATPQPNRVVAVVYWTVSLEWGVALDA
ncbi:hypothetical protein AcW2_005858 [Taiwanofungus camphoratus]|nr:hypothetical protein AcW2_005858 [Antrodia cinnamomea]